MRNAAASASVRSGDGNRKVSSMHSLLRAAAAALLAAMCASAAPAQSPSAPAGQPAQPAQPDDTVVATVDGGEITLGEVRAAHRALPEPYRNAPLQAVFQPLVQQLIDRQLVVEAARKAGIEKDPEWQAARDQTLARLMEQFYMLDIVDEQVKPEAVQKLYDERHAGKEGEPEVRARHILVASEAEAKEALAAIRGGQDFAEVAKARSQDGSAVQGGDLGYFTAEQMVPEFATAAFALEAGQVSEPVESQFGWHLIKVEDKRRQPPPAFEEVADQLRQEIARDVLTKRVEELRAAAQVQTFDMSGKPKIGLDVVRPNRQ